MQKNVRARVVQNWQERGGFSDNVADRGAGKMLQLHFKTFSGFLNIVE